MKPIQNRITTNSLFFWIFLIVVFSSSLVSGQNIEISTNSSKDERRADTAAHHSKSDHHKKHSVHETKEVSSAPHHSALSTHKIFHHRAPATLSPDHLVIGHTYNRYGEKANPKGYGIQVMTFKKIKNLQRFLHTYHKKDMYIQVIQFDPMQERMYRVILGAEENKDLVEQEISIFQRAGVHAVVRKHKVISE